ncbi:MAG: hypothetical protein ABR886_07905 [Dehalococcoidales bacterium]|jgi:hypothetical protein
MNKRTVTFIILCLLVSLLAGVSGCSGSFRSRSNAEFTIRVTGPAGAEFTGAATCEVKYLIGSRTEETDFQGALTAAKTALDFKATGTEISCKITPKNPDSPITVILLKDGTEVRRIENIELDSYISWYPPIIVDTTKATEGVRYEPAEQAGNVNEIVTFTAAEKAKIARLIGKIPTEIRQQFANEYQAWKTTWDDPKYAAMSSPFWTTVDEYKQIVAFCQAQGKQVWPLLFQQLEGEDPAFIVNDALIDGTRPACEPILEKIRQDNLHEHYTQDSQFILPYAAGPLLLAKALLVLL